MQARAENSCLLSKKNAQRIRPKRRKRGKRFPDDITSDLVYFGQKREYNKQETKKAILVSDKLVAGDKRRIDILLE